MKKYLILNPLKLFRILTNKEISILEKIKSSILLVWLIGGITYSAIYEDEIKAREEKKRIEWEAGREERERKELERKEKERIEKEEELARLVLEKKQEYDKKIAELESIECSSSYWETEGKQFVEKTFYIVQTSLESGEGTFYYHELPEDFDDIDCDWAEDFHFQKSNYMSKFNIYINYPANSEYEKCFCKGFEIAAMKYLNK